MLLLLLGVQSPKLELELETVWSVEVVLELLDEETVGTVDPVPAVIRLMVKLPGRVSICSLFCKSTSHSASFQQYRTI